MFESSSATTLTRTMFPHSGQDTGSSAMFTILSTDVVMIINISFLSMLRVIIDFNNKRFHKLKIRGGNFQQKPDFYD